MLAQCAVSGEPSILCGGRSLLACQRAMNLRPRSRRLRVAEVICQATIQFFALGLGHWKRLGMFGDTVPNGFSELDTLLDLRLRNVNFLPLSWFHGSGFYWCE